MATTIHTVRINENLTVRNGMVSARRESKTRTYLACLVATVTPSVVAERTAKLEAAKVALAEAEALLETLKVRYGMTPEAAKAKNEAASSLWFGERDKASKRIMAESGKTYIPGLDNLVTDALKAQGLTYPWDLATDYALVDTAWKVRQHTDTIKSLSRPIAVGDQVVLSWHGTPAQASKSMGSARHYSEKGYAVTVCTDIEIVTKG